MKCFIVVFFCLCYSLSFEQAAPTNSKQPDTSRFNAIANENANDFFDDTKKGSMFFKAFPNKNSIKNLVDPNTGETVTWQKVTEKPNGEPISDADVTNGNGIYRKKGNDYYKRLVTGNFIDIRIFGGKGDGVTDNTVAIRNAVDYIKNEFVAYKPNAAITKGGTIYFPQGLYRCTDSITLPEGINLLGDGRRASIFLADMVQPDGKTRLKGYKSLFICKYEFGKGGGKNEFRSLGIAGTYADNSNPNSAERHWTLKNGVELRNGFYKMESVEVYGAEKFGVYAYELIGSDFNRLYCNDNGSAGLYLGGITTTTTTTTFFNCSFRTTRRGPGVWVNNAAISTAFYNTLFEENGEEPDFYNAGNGALVTTDSLYFNSSNTMTMNVAFYTCDFERNRGSKLHAENAHIYLDETCRYTGVSYAKPVEPDFYFKDCSVKIDMLNYKGNTQNNAFHFVSRDSTSSKININASNANLNNFKFFDTDGKEHNYSWFRYITLFCINPNGVGDLRYFGSNTNLSTGTLTLNQPPPSNSTNKWILTRNALTGQTEQTDIAMVAKKTSKSVNGIAATIDNNSDVYLVNGAGNFTLDLGAVKTNLDREITVVNNMPSFSLTIKGVDKNYDNSIKNFHSVTYKAFQNAWIPIGQF